MIRTKLLDMADLEKKDWVLINKRFDALFRVDWPQVPLRRWEYVAAILFSGVLDRPGRCLEAGCGTSVFAPFLAHQGSDVDAIDPAAPLSRSAPRLLYHKMSMTELRIDSATYDYVFAISSIEHINAGRYAIPGMEFDTGDTQAMGELVRVLKPGGRLILTTDYAERYHAPPGLWPSGSHRIYSWPSLYGRLIAPFKDEIVIDGEVAIPELGDKIRSLEPKGYDYTEIIVTLRRRKL